MILGVDSGFDGVERQVGGDGQFQWIGREISGGKWCRTMGFGAVV